MLFPGVKKLGKQLEFERSDSMVIGKVKNTYVRLYDGNNCKILLMTFPEITDSNKMEIKTILDQYKIKKIEWTDNVMTINFIEIVRPYSIKKIKEIIEIISEYVLTNYPNEQIKCQNCNIIEDGKTYFLSDISYYLCKDCYNKMCSQLQTEKEEWIYNPNNYGIGFLGAFVFSIPGIIVTALLFIFLERMAAISAVLYIFLAIKGYSFFKGKITKIGAIIVNGVGIIMTCIGVYISYALNILYTIRSYEKMIKILEMDAVVREIKINVVLALVVGSFYIIFNTISMMKRWKFPELKGLRKI